MTHFHIKEATVPLDKARALESYKERLLIYDEIIRKFGNETDLGLKGSVAKALNLKEESLFALKRYRESGV